MKKNLFLAALAGVALVGCAKNEVAQVTDDSQKEISFCPMTASITKAVTPGEINNEFTYGSGGTLTYPDFAVYAFYCEKDSFDPDDSSTKTYMDDITCKYQSGNVDSGAGEGTWYPSTKYYWPKNGRLTFSAYYPTDVTATCDKKTGLSFTDFSPETDVADQYDLLFSKRAYNKTSSLGVDNTTYDGVDLVFLHALSSIKVKIKAKDTYSSDALTVTKVSFQNVYSKATFNESLASGTETSYGIDYTPLWDFTSSTTAEYLFHNASTVLTTEPSNFGSGILIPQKFYHSASEEVTLHIEYTIKNADATTINQVADFPLAKNDPSDGYIGEVGGSSTTINQWVMGYRYTYNITIGLDEIYFAPSVLPWENVNMNDIIIK